MINQELDQSLIRMGLCIFDTIYENYKGRRCIDAGGDGKV